MGVQAVLVLKYVVPEYSLQIMYFGIANVIANGLIMLRYGILGHSMLMILILLLVLLCCGSHRIWKTITHTIFRCETGRRGELDDYCKMYWGWVIYLGVLGVHGNGCA